MSCDCDPDFHAGYRRAFMVLCGVYALALIVLLGRTVDGLGGPGWAVPVLNAPSGARLIMASPAWIPIATELNSRMATAGCIRDPLRRSVTRPPW